jgi:hypothetical protein
MSDTKLRDLERRWKETGTVEDEAAYLRECVRTAQVSVKEVWSCALEGDAAASKLLGLTPLARRDTWDALARWSNAFGHDESECTCGNQICWAYRNVRRRPRALVDGQVLFVDSWITGPEWSAGGLLLVEGGAGFSIDGPVLTPSAGDRFGVDLFLSNRDFTASLVITHEEEFGPYALRAVDAIPRSEGPS